MLGKSLRSEIERLMVAAGYNLIRTSQLTGINIGNLSSIMHGNRPVTMAQLDFITQAFGLTEGALYDLYLEECYRNGKIVQQRITKYLIRCAELEKEECINKAVSTLLEESQKNTVILFEVGEKLFHAGRKKEALPFFKIVIESERDSHSERLAISEYRRFDALRGISAELNWEIAIQFEPYCRRLPDNLQLDAMLKLANIYFTLQKWDKFERRADNLLSLATAVYADEVKKTQKVKERPLKTERHLVVYYGQGFLLKGVALQMKGHFEEAKEFVRGYADLSDFMLLDDIGQEEVAKFTKWAKGNSYTLDILSGKFEILPNYTDYLDAHPEEVLSALVTIMESANKYSFQIDAVLSRFSSQIDQFHHFTDAINIGRHLQFKYQKAVYEFQKKEYAAGIEDILRCLDLCDTINEHHYFRRCAALFERHRDYSTDRQKSDYRGIVGGLCR